MCGICGIFGEGDKSCVKDMTQTLEHRGPDSWGIQFDNNCVLGHRRLAILDLSSNGDQPMSNEDETVWLVVNGEIYNYKPLRDILIGKGHKFHSESDSEVVIHAYEEYGDSFVTKLRGMFALAIYDQKGQRLVLARDHIGKKPLYYYRNGQSLVFASEIKALFKGGVPCEVNYDMIPTYLMYQYSLGADTLFRNVKKLPAAHMLVAQDGEVTVTRYWHISQHRCVNTDNPKEHLRELLEESTRLRLQSDVPVGVFLSGGVDSASVTALYRKFSPGPIHTFTATFEHSSEAEYARQTSDYLNTEHHEILITPKMVSKDIEKITWHHDEPLGDAATINTYYLAQEAKKHVTVVLAGEGGDELFGGYPWYHYASMIQRMGNIPHPLRILGRVILEHSGVGDISSRFYQTGRWMLSCTQDSIEDMVLYPTTSMSDVTAKWLLHKDFASPSGIQNRCVSDIYNQMLVSDCLNLLPEKFLMKADKGTMAFGIEERLPLLDKEIIGFAFGLDASLKKDKYILRKAVEDLLPQETVWRPKKGFGTPYGQWMLGEVMRDRVIDRILHGRLLNEVCDKDALEKVAQLLSNGQGMKMAAVSPLSVAWNLFALEIWYDVWFKQPH